MAVEVPRYLVDREQGVTLRNGASVSVHAVRKVDRMPVGSLPIRIDEAAHAPRSALPV
jgi:hypothetical protein